MNKFTTCLWFDGQAEQAVKFYTSVFKKSKVGKTAYYGTEGQEIHGGKPGSVLVVEFELDGNKFLAMNGGPGVHFSQAVSIVVTCKTQKELDYYWDKLSAGGDPAAQACGWLKDKFGLSWQVVPREVIKMVSDKDRRKAGRFMKALLQMKKLDLRTLRDAYKGREARVPVGSGR